MEINYIKLGDRIRFHRTKKGLSQDKLAELVNLSNVRISNIETGNANPTIEAIVNIAYVLNVTPNQLLIDSLQQNINDMDLILLDCTPEEVSILVENFKGLKKVLSKYQITE